MKYKFLIVTFLIFITCSGIYAQELLPSWNDGAVKKSIIQFVERVTDKNSSDYVPPEDRIATFDNDGTLWVEKPLYIQFEYEFARIHKIAENNPYLREIEPYKSIYTGNKANLFSMTLEDLVFLILGTHKGTFESAYEKESKSFLETQIHSKFKRPYRELTYLPMVELIHYLQENNFKVYIVSGGDVGFMRAFSEDIYNIPVENVIGTYCKYEFRSVEGKTEIIRGDMLSLNNDKVKPENIELFIGKKPVFAFGNSDGDIEMLQYASNNEYPSLCLTLHHDDEEREYSYDKDAEKILAIAEKNNWFVVSIKDDFKKVFLFQEK